MEKVFDVPPFTTVKITGVVATGVVVITTAAVVVVVVVTVVEVVVVVTAAVVDAVVVVAAVEAMLIFTTIFAHIDPSVRILWAEIKPSSTGPWVLSRAVPFWE
jgi:hypothetical protein